LSGKSSRIAEILLGSSYLVGFVDYNGELKFGRVNGMDEEGRVFIVGKGIPHATYRVFASNVKVLINGEWLPSGILLV